MIENVKVKIDIALDKMHPDSRAGRQDRTLWVGNIDWDSTEQEIETHLKEVGEVDSVKMPKNEEGKSRGFAFVVFKDKEIAEAAMTQQIKPFKGRELYLKRPTPSPKEGQHITRESNYGAGATQYN